MLWREKAVFRQGWDARTYYGHRIRYMSIHGTQCRDFNVVVNNHDDLLGSQAEGAGAHAVISKPWELDVLERTFSKLLK